MIGGVSLFAIGDASIKHFVESLSAFQVVALRGAFATVLMLPLFLRAGGWRTLTARPWGHALRVALGWAEMMCFFLSLRTVPLAEATALFFTAPLFMTALSVPLLGEKVGLRRWSAVIVGLVGVLIVLRPGAAGFTADAPLALAAGILYALMGIATRWLGRTESGPSLAFAMILGSGLLSGVVAPFVWIPPQPAQWLGLAGLGVIAAVAHLALAEAFRRAPMGLVAPFEYVAMVWAVSCGYVFWGELPDPPTGLGIAIVIGGGLYILRREVARAGAVSPPPAPSAARSSAPTP